MKYDGEPITCGNLAKELSVEGGKKFTAMAIGQIKNQVCGPDDLDTSGKRVYIKPSGVLKICQHIERELKMIESGEDDVVKVRVLPERAANPRFVFCADLERKCRCTVKIPAYMKQRLDSTGLVFEVERGCENGKYFYEWIDPRTKR
ncbi:MAG: hypothetical protein KAJ55_07775 [Anaerolineales bacterium]|nr:hypothetical protein [Anaerolineales bacterium]